MWCSKMQVVMIVNVNFNPRKSSCPSFMWQGEIIMEGKDLERKVYNYFIARLYEIIHGRETMIVLLVTVMGLYFEDIFKIANFYVVFTSIYRELTKSKEFHHQMGKEIYQRVMGLNASSVSTLRTSLMSIADSSFLGTNPGAASMNIGEKLLSSMDQSNSSARFNEPQSSTSEENLSTGTAQFASTNGLRNTDIVFHGSSAMHIVGSHMGYFHSSIFVGSRNHSLLS